MISYKKGNPSVWADLALFLSLMAISYFKPIPFPWKVPSIALIIVLYIYYNYDNLKKIGLGYVNWKNTFFGALRLL